MKPIRALFAGLAVICSGEALALGGLADLNVYDRTEARRLPVYWHQGRAYVVGKPGNEYQITLRSRREDVLAVVSVDGVNVITGETANPAQSGYVLGTRAALDIQGWRKSLAQTAAFYFTSLSDSYAARTGRPDDVGVIGIALFRRKQDSQQISPNAPASAAGARAAEAESRLGTGHGRQETSYAEYVAFERATSTPAEVVTLYYDSYRNLVARGVIREPVAVPPSPRPFPGFVPDPRG
jgi:hypothetical protein